MALKRPDMSKGTKKCRCGFGNNVGIVYDPEDPCEVGGKEAFIEEECDCLTPTVVGPIQARVTPISSGANVLYFSSQGGVVFRTTTPWFSIIDKPIGNVFYNIWSEKNENDLYYRHAPYLFGQTADRYWTGNKLGHPSCTFGFEPLTGADCGSCYPEWVKEYTTTKTRCCHYAIGDTVIRGMNFGFLGVNRYDPITGEMETYIEGNGRTACYRPLGASTNQGPWVILSSDVDICQEGFCDITTCLCQISPGFTWSWALDYRYPNEALYEDNTFDPLNDSHWIYV